MSDAWPPPGALRRPPTLEHVRDLWTLHGIQSELHRGDLAERLRPSLRVEHGGELIEAPLLLIADQLKANLVEQGWFEPPNAT